MVQWTQCHPCALYCRMQRTTWHTAQAHYCWRDFPRRTGTTIYSLPLGHAQYFILCDPLCSHPTNTFVVYGAELYELKYPQLWDPRKAPLCFSSSFSTILWEDELTMLFVCYLTIQHGFWNTLFYYVITSVPSNNKIRRCQPVPLSSASPLILQEAWYSKEPK